MESGPIPTPLHPSLALQEDAGMEMGYHAHPSHVHPPQVLQEGCWDGEVASHPPLLLPSCVTPQSRRVPHRLGRVLAWGWVPHHQARLVGWRQDPPSALGNPALTRDIPNCPRGTSCLLAAPSPLRAAQRGAQFSRCSRLSPLASGQDSVTFCSSTRSRRGTTELGGRECPVGPTLPTAPMGAGPRGLVSLLALSSWRLKQPPASWGQPAMSPLRPWDLSHH